MDTYKCPTGFPPREGVGHANQMIPLAAHFRSAFRSMLTRFFPREDIFLQAEEQVNRGYVKRNWQVSHLLLVCPNKIFPVLAVSAVNGARIHILVSL